MVIGAADSMAVPAVSTANETAAENAALKNMCDFEKVWQAVIRNLS